MVLPISSLTNMEYMLYGGASGTNQNCPSYLNGYRSSSPNFYGNYTNPYSLNSMYYGNYTGYPYYANQSASQNSSAQYPQQTAQSTQGAQGSQSIQSTQNRNAQTFTASKKDINTLAKFYADSNSMVQKWGDIGSSAFMIALMENAQVIKHPLNSLKAIKTTNMIFDKSAPAIKALWEKNPELMQKAYGQLHAVNRMAQPKFSFIQKWFQKPIEEGTRKELEKIMADAIKSGDEKAILKATETLKASRGMDGYIPTAWNKVKNFLGFEGKNYTPMERIANKSAEIEKIVSAPAAIKPGFTGLLKQGLKEGKTFAIFGMLIDAPKIISAFKDGGVTSGITQTLQTGFRSVADGIGWTLGRAAGTAIGTKVGAAIGSAICPGIGTAVGAAIGFLGGAAGSILASKITHAIMPNDEATRLEAQAQAKTPQGQAQLLQLVAQKAQEGEKIPDNVMKSAQNVAIALGA